MDQPLGVKLSAAARGGHCMTTLQAGWWWVFAYNPGSTRLIDSPRWGSGSTAYNLKPVARVVYLPCCAVQSRTYLR